MHLEDLRRGRRLRPDYAGVLISAVGALAHTAWKQKRWQRSNKGLGVHSAIEGHAMASRVPFELQPDLAKMLNMALPK